MRYDSVDCFSFPSISYGDENEFSFSICPTATASDDDDEFPLNIL